MKRDLNFQTTENTIVMFQIIALRCKKLYFENHMFERHFSQKLMNFYYEVENWD